MKTNYKFAILILVSILLANTTFLYAQLGKCKGKYLGNAVQSSTTSGAGINYTTYWNQATAENGSKWGSVESSQGSYNFTTSDVGYNWAKNNNGLFKYHNLVWGSQTPGYVSSASTATLTTAIENYIKAVANHYNPLGGLKLIDVVNEPIKTALPGNYKAALTAGYKRDNPNGTDQYGWIIWPFQLARKYCPNAQLLINEYSIENDPNGALVTYAAMANAVKNAPNLTDGQKNLIDGIGLQCHAFSIQNLSAANFKAALDKLYNLTGLPIHITELDLDATPNETTQKNKYQELFPVAWEHPHVVGVTLWGYVQGQTWRNGNGVSGASGTDSGIMYASGTERPALTWLKQYMAARPDLAGCPPPGGGTTTNTAPTVSITAPLNNASFAAPASITINATAADADGTVASVQFFNGTTLLGADATSPYSYSWTGVAAGTYSITAKATDNNGAVTTTTVINVTVTAAPNIAPTVSITAPLNNASFTAPASITINATAADADGTVASVQFYNGTTLVGTDATSPYSYSWTGVAAGTYSITAKATDNSGGVTTSSVVSIVVNEVGGVSRKIYIENKIFKVNGCPIYLNGANTPWQNWNDFGGNYSASFWASEFQRLKNSGINSTRVWISCNGDVQPSINTDGTVTGVSAQFWANLDDFFQSAKTNGIYVMATMMSFDHTKNTYQKYNSWRTMLNSQSKVQTYIDNYLVPFVNRYKNNPYLYSIDLCNEIEWMAENAENGNQSYSVLQRYVAMSAAAIHKNSDVLVTLGSASVKWNSPNYSTGNKWSDAALKAQFNDAVAVLDFYSPHYYGWMYSSFKSPFDMTVAQYGLGDKPVVIGEMPSVATLPTPSMAILTAFNNMKSGGYQGHYPWTSNLTSGTGDEIGTLTNFGSASLSFKNANANLVSATCTNTPPTVNITTPANSDSFTAPSNITITATATDADGSVSSVQFYNGTTLLGTDNTSPYSFSWTSVAAGTYVLTAKATDNAGAITTSTAVTITVSTVAIVQTPYNGTPANIPGKIEAEEYDLGGQGVAFNELTTGNSGNAPFRGDDVDIETTFDEGGGYNIGWVSNGEWLEYAVNVTATGTYNLNLRIAVSGTSRTLRVEMDGVSISGTVMLPNTGDWQTWETVTVSNINLTAGQKIMRVVMLSDYLNLDYISFTPVEVVPNVPPVASITAPANTAIYTAPASVTITATATDTDGTINSVRFYNGATLLNTDNTAPYTYVWTAVAAGSYSITAVATDNSSATTTSEAVNITVNPAPPNVLPVVAITAPLVGDAYTAPATINITAAASDSDGTVSNVQFYNGTILLGSDATSPYSYSWTSVAAGTYSITAKATDNSGGITTSVPVNVTVSPAPNTAPVISITAPANNASYTASAAVAIAASASDADGTVANVQFYNGTTLLGSDATSPYSFSWASVAAGTYYITAKATDNNGATTTSAAVTITVAAAPVGDIIGANCGSKNTSASFELSAANNVNATSYSWWYTGSAQSLTPLASDKSKVTVAYGANFTAGQLCAGVNYSVAPWFKQYCKAISVCAAKYDASFTDEELVETIHLSIAPNPALESFTITMPEAILSFEVYNDLGILLFKGGNMQAGEVVVLGDQFASGLYTLSVHYADNRTETKRIQKLK